MKPITQEKIDELTSYMDGKKIDLLFLADWENSRDVNMQYLSGHPMDAFLLLSPGGETTLLPWDVELAQEHAQVDNLITTEDSRNQFEQYVQAVVKTATPLIGVTASISYNWLLYIKKKIPGVKFIEDPFELNNLLRKLRSTKSPQELEKLEKAGEIGNKVLKDIEKFAHECTTGSENDLSFLVMKKVRDYGAEENAFPSLVANVKRSHLIHCHPAAGKNIFSENGLALIDYGAKYEGYASDITVPISFGKLTSEQEKIKKTCFAAYKTAIEAIDVGVHLWEIAEKADAVIKKAGYHMPHGLGHGLGLTVHDSPAFRIRPEDEDKLKEIQDIVVEDGMVFTVEPGVYVNGLGGQRLENDVMIKNGKVHVYTKCHPIEIP